MHLTQFIFLEAIARTGSMVKAAEELYVSHSAISKAVKNLERELEFEILHKVGKNVLFTPKGEMVLAQAKQILQAVEVVRQIPKDDAGKEPRIIRLSVSALISKYLLADILRASATDEGLTIRYFEDTGYHVFRRFDSGSVDLGVVIVYKIDYENFVKELGQSSRKVTAIHKGHVCFIVRKDHPLTQFAKITMNDVARYPYFTSGEEDMAASMKKFLAKYGYHHEVGIINNREELLNFTAENNCVISFLEGIYDKLYRDERLCKLSVTQAKLAYNIWLVSELDLAQADTQLDGIIAIIKEKVAAL